MNLPRRKCVVLVAAVWWLVVGYSTSAQELSEAERLTIERACEKLGVQYTHYVDFGEAERVTELFVEGGVWEGADGALEGVEEIRSVFARRQAFRQRLSRHVVTNYAIEVLDSDRARGVSYFVLFRHDDEAGAATRPMEGQPAVVGHYEDEYVRTQLGWRFKRRKAVAAFMAENQ